MIVTQHFRDLKLGCGCPVNGFRRIDRQAHGRRLQFRNWCLNETHFSAVRRRKNSFACINRSLFGWHKWLLGNLIVTNNHNDPTAIQKESDEAKPDRQR
jgi:hypothetical protein